MWLNMNCLRAIDVDWNQHAFLAQMTSFVVQYDIIYHFFQINSQYLMTWGGLTALFRRSCSSQLLINRVVSCTCDLSFVPTRVEMETWMKHDKDIDSPTLVPRPIRAIRVRGRRLGNSPDKLNS